MKKLYIYCFLIALFSCKKKEENNSILQVIPKEQETYYEDTTYKYENRTGTSGNYEYNYDVSGTDENGDTITGNVAVEGKYGVGLLTNSEGNEFEVEVEWIDYGKLKATDQDGIEYDLQVN